MLEPIKKRLRDFADSPPGERFQRQYQQRSGEHGGLVRALRLAGGVVVTLIGIVLMPAPGPGTLIAVLGLSLLAHESLAVARALDATELRLRPAALAVLNWWRRRRR